MSEHCCLFCHTPLIRAPGERSFEFAKRKYCNHRCSTNHRKALCTARVPPRNCRYCGKLLVRRPNEQLQAFKRRRNCVPLCCKPARDVKREQARAAKKAPAPKPLKADARRNRPQPIINSAANAEAIAAYVLSNGVTRCPTAASATTTATVPPDDRNAVCQYHEDLTGERPRRHQSNAARNF
jgi:hypothetical protein